MAVDLTPEGISMLLSGTYTTTIKPVLQVIDIKCSNTRTRISSNGVENKSSYEIALSDGSVFKNGISNYRIDKMIRSKKLQKGSIVQLTDYSSNTNSFGSPYIGVSVYNLKVIRSNCVILGDPKPFPGNKTDPVENLLRELEEEPLYPDMNGHRDHADEYTPSKQKCYFCSETSSRKRQRQSCDYKEDDEIGACFEKLEKLGWEEGPMYDTAVLLFGESSDYRKIWLHVKPNSCENWVKNAGSKYGLLA